MQQTINGEKTFSNTVLVKNGRGSIKVYPPNGQVGPATFHTYRYADQAMPMQGDHWEFGNDLISNIQGWEWLQRSFRHSPAGAEVLDTSFLYQFKRISIRYDMVARFIVQASIHPFVKYQ
jgi:hypothetical protein